MYLDVPVCTRMLLGSKWRYGAESDADGESRTYFCTYWFMQTKKVIFNHGIPWHLESPDIEIMVYTRYISDIYLSDAYTRYIVPGKYVEHEYPVKKKNINPNRYMPLMSICNIHNSSVQGWGLTLEVIWCYIKIWYIPGIN
jgi:hypothetical protein